MILPQVDLLIASLASNDPASYVFNLYRDVTCCFCPRLILRTAAGQARGAACAPPTASPNLQLIPPSKLETEAATETLSKLLTMIDKLFDLYCTRVTRYYCGTFVLKHIICKYFLSELYVYLSNAYIILYGLSTYCIT